jgi:hypothetical protein
MPPTSRDDSDLGKSLAWKGVLVLGCGFVLYWAVSWWRYPPAVEFDNLKYIQLLRTAVSSERPDWVAKVKEAVELRVNEGAMSEPERSHFLRVIELAEAKKWKAAHEVCFQFEEAQLNRRRQSQPNSAEHHHAHD